MDRPLEHTIQEAQRITEAAAAAGVSVKLLGGPGVFLHSPSAQHPPLKRKYGDLDFAVGVFNWPGTPKPRPEWVFLYENLLH